mgnify:CR=1 FL=1
MDRRVRQGQDVVVTVTKNPAIGIGWLKEARQKISAIDLDVLVHLDLTLNPMSHRVAMSRLAPVQACSGHTMSSGIDRKVISYYISWGAAEGTAITGDSRATCSQPDRQIHHAKRQKRWHE